MRRAFLNPCTVLAATVALFFVLKGGMGRPTTGGRALLFLFIYGYGCISAYLVVFGTSAWIPVLRKLTFPDAYANPVFMTGMSFSGVLPKVMIGCALALYVFGADPSGVTSFAAALLAVSAAAATVPIMRSPCSAPVI